jgi:hypothetical protein
MTHLHLLAGFLGSSDGLGVIQLLLELVELALERRFGEKIGVRASCSAAAAAADCIVKFVAEAHRPQPQGG